MYKRLKTILSLIDPSAVGVIDVGTDHGFIPISLALSGFPGAIIASDVNELPLSTAMHSAHEAGVSDKIAFRLGNGLDCCRPGEVDTVIIAGLGGDLISSIIDRAEWTMTPGVKLILQPMTKAEVLRYFLTCNGYSIVSENPVSENGKLFSILFAEYSGQNTFLADAELFTGKVEQVSSDPLFGDVLSAEYNKIYKAVKGLESSASGSAQERFLSNILNSLEAMKDIQK